MLQHMTPRNTKTKQKIEDIFQKYKHPLPLQQVFELVKKKFPSTALSTVYRVIHSFQVEGKLIQVDWRQRGSQYEWANRQHHHHLVCDTCGKVTDVDDQVIGFHAASITQKTGFLIQDHSIEMKGICSPCQENQK
jgi:Fur family ferric uptake transcriptional regulator